MNPITNARVTVEAGEPVDKAIRKFRRECERGGLLSEIRNKQFHMKPSARRKWKASRARHRLAKALRRAALRRPDRDDERMAPRVWLWPR